MRMKAVPRISFLNLRDESVADCTINDTSVPEAASMITSTRVRALGYEEGNRRAVFEALPVDRHHEIRRRLLGCRWLRRCDLDGLCLDGRGECG